MLQEVNPSAANEWMELIFTLEADLIEPIETALLSCGALAITLTDSGDAPIFEPGIGETPVWPSTALTALFAAPVEIDPLILQIQDQFYEHTAQNSVFPSWTTAQVPDQDWERACLAHYQPMQFGEQFWVIPSWITPPNPSSVNMLIDPGLAFGTGSHETTSLCLQWLADHQALLQQPDCHVIDFGCGSGILGISAQLLGAAKVTAIDIDPQAILATQQNGQLNQLSDTHFVTKLFNSRHEAPPSCDSHQASHLTDPHGRADLIIANILFAPLLQLSGLFQALLKPKGHLVLSGVMDHQCLPLSEAYRAWIRLEPINAKNAWSILSGQAEGS